MNWCNQDPCLVSFGLGRDRVIVVESRTAPRKIGHWQGLGEHSRCTTWAKIFCSTFSVVGVITCWLYRSQHGYPWIATLSALASVSLWMPEELWAGQREGTETCMFFPDRWTTDTFCGRDELGVSNNYASFRSNFILKCPCCNRHFTTCSTSILKDSFPKNRLSTKRLMTGR